MNADFDGDQLQGFLVLDDRLRKRYRYLEPFYDIHSTSNPGQIKSTIKLPDVLVSNIFNWLDDEELVI